MRTSHPSVRVPILRAASLVTLFACSQRAPTDAEIRHTPAELKVPSGQRQPTVEDFRGLSMMGPDGRMRPATADEVHAAYEWSTLPHELARKHYPAVMTNLNSPEGFTLAFILKDRATVLRYASLVLHGPEGAPLLQTCRCRPWRRFSPVLTSRRLPSKAHSASRPRPESVRSSASSMPPSHRSDPHLFANSPTNGWITRKRKNHGTR